MGNKSGLCSRAVLKEILDRWCHFQPSGQAYWGFYLFQEFSRTSKFIQEIMVWSIRCFHIA